MRKFPLLVITVVLLPSVASPVHGMVCGIAGPWNCFEPQATPLPHEQEQRGKQTPPPEEQVPVLPKQEPRGQQTPPLAEPAPARPVLERPGQ
jgi:hypothetical protein